MGGPVITVPSDALRVTTSCTVAPTRTFTGFGLTSTVAIRWLALNVHDWLPFAFAAVIVAEPVAAAIPSPLLETRMTVVFGEDQLTVRPCFVESVETS